MRLKLLVPVCAVGTTLALVGCSQPAEQAPAQPAAPPAAAAAPTLGIKPFGTADPNFKPDYSSLPPELQKTFTYIDEHIDEHAENLRKWIQQPSISNSGEGIPESAEMVKGFYEELGCQDARVVDTGITEYGSPGNPIVYAKCDFGAPKTVAVWWQYDTMPVTQPDNWIAPPFEARVVDGQTAVVPTASRVIIGRGATNSKGGEMATLNAFRSLKAVMGTLPVNLIFVAEGDEERMDIGLRKFFQDHSDLMQEADVLWGGGGSEGCVYVELTTSGTSWGRGPTISDIHGVNKRTVDSPAWRHIKMLSSLISDDGNTPLIKGWFENKEAPTPAEVAQMKEQAKNMDLVAMAKSNGVARYIHDTPYEVLKDGRFETSFNLDGIWGGNMYAGGAGAILPNKVTSKHNIRYVPRMMGLDIVKKIRAQLDANGYKDVEMKLIGDVPWSRGTKNPDNDMTLAHRKAGDYMAQVGLGGQRRFGADGAAAARIADPNFLNDEAASANLGGYWPSYLWADGEVGEKVGTIAIPMGSGGGGGGGGRAHAANEYYTVESLNKSGGMASAEKSAAAALFEFAKITNVPPKPKTPAKAQ
ncbi:MAG: M20/M25/M40 family metallo-hydrolase [Acidobacteria bacterium]|nr:M20/M25/M40 family metallo-hydrolase [Acidobacteriota bacterium]